MQRLKTTTSLALATAVCLSPATGFAQGWGAYLKAASPDRLIQHAVQIGIMALRTQVDLKYGDISVNAVTGYVSMTDVQMWPLPDWDENGDCEVSADRVTLRTTPIDDPDRMRIKVQATGLEADPSCLPPDMKPALQATQLQELIAPLVTLDVDYTISSAEADVHLFGEISDLAAVDLNADFSYFWFEASEGSDPYPVAFLSNASLSVQNLGGWNAVKPMLPPPMADPQQAPLMVEGMLGSMLADANRSAGSGNTEDPDPSRLNEQQQAFLESVKETWPAFLNNPDRLVLETGTAADDDIYLDFEFYEHNPRALFEDLKPKLSLTASAQRSILPLAMLQSATGGGASDLTPEDQRRVGMALLTGTGAPRDIKAGMALLSALAEQGDGEAALEMARALEKRDPKQAYTWALQAGLNQTAGASGLMDRMERELPFAEVLALQSNASDGAVHDVDALSSISGIREQAVQRFSGLGQTRSYGIATMWSVIAAAAGDAEARGILEEIDARVLHSDADGQAAWQSVEELAISFAMEAWIGQDLPARFKGGQ